MFSKIITKLFGTKFDRDVKTIRPIVEEINLICETLKDWPDEKFPQRTAEFQAELKELKEDLEKQARHAGWDRETRRQQYREEIDAYFETILPEAFAMVKETCRRLLGQSWDVCGIETTWDMIPYDVQLIGGIALHQGRITEMATGEGKTLVATMPLYLNALAGNGVHLVTVNDYLARRDSEWMGEIFKFLGLTIGCIQHDQDPEERKKQYNCDITYGTNNEFGFDYLRDNMAVSLEYKVQRGHFYAIVDEVDSVLVDEARTPLIISGPVEGGSQRYQEMQPLVDRLVKRQIDFVNKMVTQAEKQLETNDTDEAALSVLAVQRGAPKNKRLLKLYKEQGVKKLAQTCELTLMRDKKLHELDEELYYAIDEREHTINLTEKGRDLLSPEDKELFVLPDITEGLHEIDTNDKLSPSEKQAEKEKLYVKHSERAEKNHAINQLLKAYSLYEKDVEYVVQEGKVLIVDEFTGRLMPGRRFSEGLHQAIEAKERVRVEGETQTVATITLQNYFRMYAKLAGMTGTAETESAEFFQIYKLDVMVIPTNRPIRRVDYEDQIFRTRSEKYNAIIEDIERLYRRGLPVLVGTVSVEASETLSRMLKRKRIEHSVLNAKYHQKEAEIVRFAGRAGAVTIATNMAGRGTDIKLEKKVITVSEVDPLVVEELKHIPEVEGLGLKENEEPFGLNIIGTERHESRRIDRQLRGRAGRQGDYGTSRFFLSLEDDLMRLFASDRIAAVMDRLGIQEGEVITHRMITKAIERAQKRVETQNFSIRKHTLDYDDVMNYQRQAIYGRRDEVLEEDSLKDEIEAMIPEVAQSLVNQYYKEDEETGNVDLTNIASECQNTFLISLDRNSSELKELTRIGLVEKITELALAHLHQKEEALGEEIMRRLESYALLSTIDTEWKDHLYEMDQLRGGIGLRAYGQRDPLIEYKKEAYHEFTTLLANIDRKALQMVFRLQPVEQPQAQRADSRLRTRHESITGMQSIQPQQPDETKPAKRKPVVRQGKKIGRNDPCPCGSGKKYKKCCGAV